MGRSFERVCQGMKSIAERWTRSSGALKKRISGMLRDWLNWQRDMRAKPSLPATILSKIAVFSALVETIKRQDRIELIRKEDVDF